MQIKETNGLPDPTTTHIHGLHQPNESDGVAGISQVDPIKPGASFDYPAFTPGHVGSFSYHSHFEGGVQDMRGLDGMWDVLPRMERESVKADVDINMTLQIWGWESEGSLVQPFGTGPDGGKFPFDTINGKTGDASGSAIEIEKGQRVRDPPLQRLPASPCDASARTRRDHRVQERARRPDQPRDDAEREPGRLLRDRSHG